MNFPYILYKYRYRDYFLRNIKNSSKNVQKSLWNICTVIFLSISLHPQSGNNTGCNGSEKGFQQREIKLLKNFSKKVSKNLVVTKKGFTFAPLSAPKKWGGQKWEILSKIEITFFEDIEQLRSFIHS